MGITRGFPFADIVAAAIYLMITVISAFPSTFHYPVRIATNSLPRAQEQTRNISRGKVTPGGVRSVVDDCGCAQQGISLVSADGSHVSRGHLGYGGFVSRGNMEESEGRREFDPLTPEKAGKISKKQKQTPLADARLENPDARPEA